MILQARLSRHTVSSLLIPKNVSVTISRNFSITPALARAGAVDHNRELFDYTSGRWIYNEDERLAERRGFFDVHELKTIAARAVNQPACDVQSLRKWAEGGFNRIFEIRMIDGTCVLARMPYPSTLPRRWAVASEVATMDFVRTHGIPTPRVLGYDVGDNSVGSEYLILEKLPGRPIGEAWLDLSEQQRLQVLHDVVKLEANMFSIQLPASGSIYYARDLEPGTPSVPIPGLDGRFCVGPYAGSRWWVDRRADLELDRGPHTDPLRVLQAPAEKELAWLTKYGRPRYPCVRQYREALEYKKQDPRVHAESLESYLRITSHLVPRCSELQAPVLRHPDIQPDNIFISDDYRVTSLLDWQHAIVLPTFLSAGMPNSFQNYSDPGSLFFSPPHAPTDLDSLDEPERTRAQETFRRRHVHFFYLGFTERFNERHWRALSDKADLLRRRIFDHASEPWQGLNTTLHYDLLQISKNWHFFAPQHGESAREDYASGEPCPVSFTQEEGDRIEALMDSYREADGDVERILGMMGVGLDGWTTHECFEGAKSRAAEVREQGLASVEDEPWLREMSERHWPFDDGDEEE